MPAGVTAETENLYGFPATSPPITRSALPLAFEITIWLRPVKVYRCPLELVTTNASTRPWHNPVFQRPSQRALLGAYQIRLAAFFPG